jgi:integrase
MGRGKGVRAASKSSIGISFQYNGARCREKLKLAPTPANKKFAERLKATIEHELATGTFDYAKHFPTSKRARKLARTPGAAIKIGEQLITWLDSHENDIEPETFTDYELDIEKRLKPAFGEMYLTDQIVPAVQKWAHDSGLSRKRLSNILTPLRSMFREAASSDPPLIPRDPLYGFKLGKRVRTTKPRDSVDPFTHAEIAAICKHSDPQFADFVTFWSWTGLRLGEIVELHWPDIDFIHGHMRIERAMREYRVKDPKTEAGKREVKLLAPALAALQRQKGRTFIAGAHVWHNPRTDSPWTSDGQIRKTVWQYALKRAGVRYRGPKQLRHTYGSWMCSAREPLPWIAAQMGHTDWTMTARVYARWIDEVDPLAGSRAVEAILGSNRATESENAN